MKKIVITEELKEVLNNVNNVLSKTILDGSIDETQIADPEKYINYLDISHTNKGHLSYLTQERIVKVEETEEKDYWRPGMRYHGRPGSVLKKLFHKDLSRHFEDFSIKYISIVDKPDFHFELVKGSDIAKYYDSKNYREHSGNLGSSCMARCPSIVFDFYVNNEDTINMLVMLDQHNKVMGRAIVWNGKDFRVMDRIYVSNDLYTGYFTDWAKEHDVFYKQYNNFRTPLHMVDPKTGDYIIKKFCVELTNSKFEKYPYLDSFKWLDIPEKKLYNYTPDNIYLADGSINKNVRVIADSMNGSLRGDCYGFDDITNEMYSGNEIQYLEYLNLRVYRGYLRRSKSLGCHILNKHAVKLEEINDYIFNDEYDHLNDNVKIEEYKKSYLAHLEEMKNKKPEEENSEKIGYTTQRSYTNNDWEDDWWNAPTATHRRYTVSVAQAPQESIDEMIDNSQISEDELNEFFSDPVAAILSTAPVDSPPMEELPNQNRVEFLGVRGIPNGNGVINANIFQRRDGTIYLMDQDGRMYNNDGSPITD